MNACQLLFLLEVKRFENPPFQGHVSICSKSGERNKTTKKKKKRASKKKNNSHKYQKLVPPAVLGPGGYTHTRSPSAPPSMYMQDVRAPRLGSVYLYRQGNSHSLYRVPVLANKLERGIGC